MFVAACIDNFFLFYNSPKMFALRGRFRSLICVAAGTLKLPVSPADALKSHLLQIFPVNYKTKNDILCQKHEKSIKIK